MARLVHYKDCARYKHYWVFVQVKIETILFTYLRITTDRVLTVNTSRLNYVVKWTNLTSFYTNSIVELELKICRTEQSQPKFVTLEMPSVPQYYDWELDQELRSWFEVNAQFPFTTPAAHMTNSAGLLFQYLSLSSTYTGYWSY